MSELLCSSLHNSKVDIACLQDTRLSGSGVLEFQHYSLWFSGRPNPNDGSFGGVAIAISAKLIPSAHLLLLFAVSAYFSCVFDLDLLI